MILADSFFLLFWPPQTKLEYFWRKPALINSYMKMLFSMAYRMFSMTDTASATGRPPSVCYTLSFTQGQVGYVRISYNALFAALRIRSGSEL